MKVKGLRWWIIVLIFIATVINYIDRTAFALLWPEMGKDLGMDNSDYALMLNIFMIAYAASKFLSYPDAVPSIFIKTPASSVTLVACSMPWP